MSRLWPGIGLVIVLAPLVASAAPAVGRRPSVEVVDDNPVVVEGRGFAAREKVTLRTHIAGQAYKQTVTADADGHFKAQMAETDAQCDPFRVSAAGDRKSRAVTPRRIPPPCGMQMQQ